MIVIHLLQEVVIPMIGGVYATLLGLQIIPRKPKNPELYEYWYLKYGKLCLYGGILLIAMSIIRTIWLILEVK